MYVHVQVVTSTCFYNNEHALSTSGSHLYKNKSVNIQLHPTEFFKVLMKPIMFTVGSTVSLITVQLRLENSVCVWTFIMVSKWSSELFQPWEDVYPKKSCSSEGLCYASKRKTDILQKECKAHSASCDKQVAACTTKKKLMHRRCFMLPHTAVLFASCTWQILHFCFFFFLLKPFWNHSC